MKAARTSVARKIGPEQAPRAAGRLDSPGDAKPPTPPASGLRDFAAFAASVCATPIALISQGDAHAQSLVAVAGLPQASARRVLAFCDRVARQDSLLVARKSPVRAERRRKPAPRAGSPVVFQAGVPLLTTNARLLGTLCVMDRQPRRFGARERAALGAAARLLAARWDDFRRPVGADDALDPHDASRLAAIVTSSQDAIFSLDLRGVVTSWNRSAEDIFGYRSDEMIGASIRLLYPPDRQDEADRILETSARGESIEHLETIRLAKDGRPIEVSVGVSPIRDALGTIVGSSRILRDVTALRQREREALRLSRLYEALSQVNQAIVWTRSRDELLHKVCRILVERAGFTLAWIGWREPRTQQIVPLAVCGAPAEIEDYVRGIHVYADSRPEGQGPAGRAFRSGRRYISNNLQEDAAALPWREAMTRYDLHAAAALPIRENGSVQGTLVVYSKHAGFFQEREIALLEETATDLGFGLDNLRRVDEAHAAEIAVERERRFTDAIIESMPGILHVHDSNGRLLRWNRQFEQVSGYTANEIAQMRLTDFFAETDKALLETKGAEVVVSGSATLDAAFITKDGRSLPYFFTTRGAELEGTPIVICIGIDMTAHIKAEKARRLSEERYQRLFDFAPDGIVLADRDGVYLEANPSICRMLGYARDELVGRHSREIVAPAEEEHIAPALRVIASGADYHREWVFRRKDGSTFAADVIGALTPDGTIMGMIRDITDRKRGEQALRDLNETLEQRVATRTDELRAALIRAEAADRIKSSFLATMSHELRTPLNSIIGFTGIVLMGLAGSLSAEQTHQLGLVQSSARHLLNLINDVLDLSKIEAGQFSVVPEPFELRAAIDRAVALVRPLADKKGLALDMAVDPGVGELHSDSRRVQQILINLLNNAVKFTDTGSVTVTVEPVLATTGRESPVQRRGVRIAVADTGIGIKPEAIDLLFKPFQQIDDGPSRHSEGTGLGLAISQGLAHLLGGEIEVISEWGRGSRFTVFLPTHFQPDPP